MTSRLNITDFNWLVSASTIQSNQNQNLTLDASNASIILNRNGIPYATFTNSFNFTNLPFCSQVPTNDNQLVNKAYIDNISNDPGYTIDMDVFNQTFKKDTLTSSISTVVKNSNIISSIDAPVNQSQVYTFGQSTPNRWISLGTDSTSGTLIGVISYSSDGITWTRAIASTNFFSVGYEAVWNGNLWVAVGDGSTGALNTLAYSYDGISWTGLGKTIFSTVSFRVAWNGMMFVAVGLGTNTVAYSYDGINWTGLGTTVFGTQAMGIAWNGNLWVAVGQGANNIAYSSNGINWTGVTGTSIFSSQGWGVAWNGNLWVAVGGGPNTISYSSNGINWIGLGSSIFNPFGYDVAWNGVRWVAVGQGGNTIAHSTNGINWTGLGTTIFSPIGRGVAWNGTRWVAVGQGINTIAYSSDGLSWIGLGASTSTFIGTGYGISFNNARQNTITYPSNLIVIVGAPGGGGNGIHYSTNGLTWTAVTGTSLFSLYGYGIGWNGKIWVAGGEGTNNTLAYSYDGINWVGLGTTIFTQNCNGVVWGNNKWTAVGYGVGASGNSIAYSYDGINWIGLGKTIFTGILGARGIGYNGTRWVAVGGQNAPTIGYSDDGINWNPVSGSQSIFGVYGECVAWNGRLWLAGGSQNVSGPNTIAYSYDGINWFGAGNSVITSTCQGLDWNGNMWVAVGSLGANTIAYSYNGLNWTGVGSTFFQTNGAASVKWCGNIWVAIGDGGNNTAYSYNGVNWFAGGSITTRVFELAWNAALGNTYIQQPTIACGEGTNTLAYSPDGIFWNGLGTNIFTTRCFHVAWNGTRWVAVGQGTNTIAYSTDGVNWTGIGASIFTTSGYVVTWNGTLWVAGGQGTNIIAYSSDGISWSGSSSANTLFTSGGLVRGIAWNGVSFVAVGSNGTTALIAYSTDGITWSQSITINPASFPTGSVGYCVAYSNNQWLAGFVGNSLGTISLLYTTTKNGSIGWQIQGTVSTSGATGGIYSMAYNGANWVLVGESSASGILYYGLETAIPPVFTTRTTPFTFRGTGVTWNGVRYVATGIGTYPIYYSFDGSGNWFPATTSINVFTSSIGHGVAGNSRLGFPVVDSQIVLNQNSYGLSNKLDISSAGYFNNGFTNFSTNIKPSTFS